MSETALKLHLPHHPTQLYLIRHGEVEERYHKVFGGCRIDMGLSPLGQRQGQAASEWLRDTPLDAIYASPPEAGAGNAGTSCWTHWAETGHHPSPA